MAAAFTCLHRQAHDDNGCREWLHQQELLKISLAPPYCRDNRATSVGENKFKTYSRLYLLFSAARLAVVRVHLEAAPHLVPEHRVLRVVAVGHDVVLVVKVHLHPGRD